MSNEFGWVYLVHAGETDLYKIGCTTQEPEDRLSSLQTASPHELHLQYAVRVDGYKGTEEFLHDLYSECREQNEWFRFSEEEAFDVQRKMRSRLRFQQLERATEPLKELRGDFLNNEEEFLTTILADIAGSLKYEEEGNAIEILKKLNRVNLLPKYYRDTIEEWLDQEKAREILKNKRIVGNNGWICLVKAEGTDFCKFRATKQEPKALLDAPIPKFLKGESSEELNLIDAYEVENIDQVEREIEEKFSFMEEKNHWLLLEKEEDLEMILEEMRLTVRKHQFRDLKIEKISGEYVTDAEEILTDVLSELVSYMARSNIDATQVLQALYLHNLLPPSYEEVIRNELGDDTVHNILGERPT